MAYLIHLVVLRMRSKLGVSSDYAKLITGQVTEVTCPVIGRAHREFTPSKKHKTVPDLSHPATPHPDPPNPDPSEPG